MVALHAHRRALVLMVLATLLWSMAGVITRHLETARGVEVTFWRSVFAGIWVAGATLWQYRHRSVHVVRSGGWTLFASGAMWAVMFCCFMLALTMTTVANTLLTMSIAPLSTAVLARFWLGQRLQARTSLAIIVAAAGMIWMFAGNLQALDARGVAGMTIALGVPLAASLNVIIMKKRGQQQDLAPAVWLGAVLSALAMAPLAWPLHPSGHDLFWMAVLGFFQLGLPCTMMVYAARHLSAAELSLLALLEVLFGPLWAWLGAQEVPGSATLMGGALVLLALIGNEVAALRADR